MTRNDDKRAAILERLADHMLARGLSASSLRPLAKAARTSDRMLLYYFVDKDELVGATLEVVAARLTMLLAARTGPPLPYDQLLPHLAEMLLDDALWPYMRLWLELASMAASGGPLAKRVGGQLGRAFLAWDMALLDCPDDASRMAQAAKLLVTIEGLVLLKSIGLDDIGRAALAGMKQ